MSVWKKTEIIEELTLDGRKGLISSVYPIDKIDNVEYELKGKNNIQRTSFRIGLSDLTKENLLGIIKLANPSSYSFDVNNARMTFTHNTNLDSLNLDFGFQCENVELEIYNNKVGCYEAFSLSAQTEMKLLADMDDWFERNCGVNTMNMLKMAVYTPEQYLDYFKADDIEKHIDEADEGFRKAFDSIDDILSQNDDSDIIEKCENAKSVLSDKATTDIEATASQLENLINNNAFDSSREAPANVPKDTFEKVEGNKKTAFKDKIKSAVSGIGRFAVNVMNRSGSTKNIERILDALKSLPIPNIPGILKDIKLKKVQKEIMKLNDYQYTLQENSNIIKNVAKSIADKTAYDVIRDDCHEVIRASGHLENQDNVGKFCKTVDRFVAKTENSNEIDSHEKNSIQGGITRIKAAVRNIEQNLSAETKSQVFYEGKSFESINQSLRMENREVALNGVKMPSMPNFRQDNNGPKPIKRFEPELA